jgi:hypothetical protein
MTWHPGEIHKAWDEINQSLCEVMKQLPRETLQFLAFRATDSIIRHKAAEVLDWLENRGVLPEWGWFLSTSGERLRCHA